MTRDDVNMRRALKLAGGNDDAPVPEARVDQFAAALRRLRVDPAEAARIERIVADVDKPMAAKASDLALVESQAFFRRNYRDLVHILVVLGASMDEAKEAVGETLVELVQRWSDLTHPLAWARRAALNRFREDRARGLQRVRQKVIEHTPGGDVGRDDLGLTVWDDKTWVAQLLERLPAKQQNVMALVLDGFTSAEITERLGRSPDAVWQNLLEAGKRLQPLAHRERAVNSSLDSHDHSTRRPER